MRSRICRLCFRTSKNFQVIDANTKDVLEKLQLRVNLAVSEEPVMCINCAETLKKSFDFKTICVDTHDYIVSFLDHEENAKLDLNKIFLSKKENGFGIPEDQTPCAFCMGLVKKCSAVFLDDKNSNVMLKKCLPELDFSNINTPIICGSCQESLINYFHFMEDCLIFEEKIQKYSKAEGINREGVVELIDVQQFISSNMLRIEEGSNTLVAMKKYKTVCGYGENTDDKVKHNDGNLMEEEGRKLNSAQQFISNNALICKEKCNKADVINTEGTIYVEAGIKIEHKNELCEELEDIKFISVNGGLTEVQNQNLNSVQQFTPKQEDKACLNIENIEIKLEPYDFDSLQSENASPQPTASIFWHNGSGEQDVKVASHISTYQCELFPIIHTHLNQGHSLKHNMSAETKLYQCYSCDFNTKYKNNLLSHMLVHKDPLNVTMHQCGSCSFQTKRKQTLNRHMLSHKDPSEIKVAPCESCSVLTDKDPSEIIVHQCDSCDYRTKYKGSLLNHKLVHKDPSEVKMYPCDSCDYKTKYKSGLFNHMLVHIDPSEIEMYPCDTCDYKTKYKSNLDVHMSTHKDPSERTAYLCEFCSFQTKYNRSFNMHLLTHKDPSAIKMHQCDSCDFKTKYKNNLEVHKSTHKDPSEITMYQCESCPFKAKYKSHVRRHALIHKEPSEVTIHQCNFCSFKSKHKRNLHRHILTHKDLSKYQCEFCSYCTKYKGNLKSHMANHESSAETKMFHCHSCSFQTNHKSGVQRHMAIHKLAEATFFQCHFCTFNAQCKKDLRKHMSTHPEEIIYRCDFCSYQTKYSFNHERHKLVHKGPSEISDSCSLSDTAMYQCDSCSFKTMYKCSLQRHVFIHKDPSATTTHQCDFCPFQTKYKRSLQKHVATHKRPKTNNAPILFL